MEVSNHIFEQALDRLVAITWEENIDRRYSHIALMNEYLRRSALWTDKLQLDPLETGPFFDIAALLVPERHVPQANLDELYQRVQAGRLIQGICAQYLRWVLVEASLISLDLPLQAPYEPLIRLFERGGIFRKEHLFIDFIGAAIPLNNWYATAKQRKPISLDDESLDTIDQNHQKLAQ